MIHFYTFRSDKVIEDRIPNKQICLENGPSERSATYESIESNLPLQYLKRQLIAKNKKISSLKRQNRRLSLSNSKLKSRIKQMQSENAKLVTEKKLMRVSISVAKIISKS